MLLMNFAPLLLALASFQEPGPQTPGPMMWTGESQSVPRPPEKDAPVLADSLRGELKALVTRTDVQRDYQKQLEKLDTMRAVACWSFAYPGKAEIAVEIACTRADWLEKLGRHEDAVYAAWHPFVMPEEKTKAPYDRFVWAPSNGKLAELVNRIDELPVMVELHKRFPSDAPSTKGGDAIEDAVRRECLEGNPMTLTNFGTRCVPALVRILRENPRQMNERHPVDSTGHPLGVLMQIDRAAAERLLLSTLGTRGPDWTLRAIFCLSNLLVTKQGLVASADPYSPSTSSDPLTLQVVDALAREGMPAPRLFSLLEPLVGNDIVSPDVRDFLLHQVQATDPNILSPLRSMLDGVRVGPNKRVLYEAFLDSPDPELRWRCADALLRYEVGPATLRAAGHSDPNVRRGGLRALVRHYVRPYDYTANSVVDNVTGRWLEVPHTPEVASALKELARDPENSVRLALVQALQESGMEPAAELLELVLSDPERQVRQAAAYPWPGRRELQARVLERLAGDGNATVLRVVGDAFAMCSPKRHSEWAQDFPLLVPGLAKWLANPALSVSEKDGRTAEAPLEAALADPASAKAVFEACARGPHRKELLPVLAMNVQWAKNNSEVPVVYDVLDAASIAELFVAACAQDVSRADWTTRAIVDFAQRGAVEGRPFLELARDESLSVELRLRALRIAAAKDDPALKPLVLSFLRGAKADEFRRRSPANPLPSRLEEALRGWPGLGEVRSEVCTDMQIPDAIALFVASLDPKAPALDAAATRACLQRWARVDEDWKSANTEILYFLDPGVDGGVLELWKKSHRDPKCSWRIVDAMERFPCDESVPMLADSVRAEWLLGSQSGEHVRNTAIAALTKRLDDLGADALLKAIANAPSEDVRKKCFEGLEQIRKYQDEKQNWQTRRNGQAARDAAVAELVPMLDDADAATRASAARSLATLRATEHLPRLVRLLKDKDATVRDAAQKALDALNAPEPKKP